MAFGIKNQGDLGRVDWMPRLKLWRIIGYRGNKDIEIDRVANRQLATLLLQAWINGGKRLLHPCKDCKAKSINGRIACPVLGKEVALEGCNRQHGRKPAEAIAKFNEYRWKRA